MTRALKALENGGNAESRGETGNSPFHVAAYRNHENVVKALLRQGVNVLHTGRSGNTALHYASRRGHLGVVKVLLDRDDSKRLINMKNEKGFTALHLATLSLRKEVVMELVSRGIADVNMKDGRGVTALHYCALRDSVDIAQILLKFGADHLIEREKKLPSDVCRSEKMKLLLQDASHRRCEWFHLVEDEDTADSSVSSEMKRKITKPEPKFPFKRFLSSDKKDEEEEEKKTEVTSLSSVETTAKHSDNDNEDDVKEVSLTGTEIEEEDVPRDYASMLLDHDEESDDMMSFFTKVEQSVLEKMKAIVDESTTTHSKEEKEEEENAEYLCVGASVVVTSDATFIERACLDVTIKSSDLAMPWGVTEMGKRRKRTIGTIVRVLEIDHENEIAKVELGSKECTWMPISTLLAPTKENIERHQTRQHDDDEEVKVEDKEETELQIPQQQRWTRDEEIAVVLDNAKIFERACLDVTLSSTTLAMPWGVTEAGIKRQRSLGQTVRVVEVDDENNIAEVRLKDDTRVWVPLAVLMKYTT